MAFHETAEEEAVHPSARRLLQDGEQVVDDRLEEERAAKEKLSRLDDMNPDDPGFMPALRELRADVLQHAASQEQYECPGAAREGRSAAACHDGHGCPCCRGHGAGPPASGSGDGGGEGRS
ncbi:hypothetical protein AB0D65_13485 [Streptomyces griseoloalbus]|uniref:Hemerythrin-like domain-containing protein n=1 Tax=Streptomyces griseoloalbus TaxID=67303 RepID=A0ABV3E4B1_9ACTN